MNVTDNTVSRGDPSLAASGEEGMESKDTVAFETHKKLLSEKKRIAEEKARIESELADLKRAQKEREEAEAVQKQDWKKLLEQREKDLAEERSKHQELRSGLQQGRKLKTVLDQFTDASVDEKLWSLIPLDEVAVNPQTEEIDMDSAKAVARKFEKEFGKFLDRRNGQRLPNEASQSATGTKLTVSQYYALPTAAEMKKRYKDVDWSTS